jgi:hypothetical protein
MFGEWVGIHLCRKTLLIDDDRSIIIIYLSVYSAATQLSDNLSFTLIS